MTPELLPSGLAGSQASLNEIVASVIIDWPAGQYQIERVITALQAHNQASGFPFHGIEPSMDGSHYVDVAVYSVRAMVSMKKYRARRAQLEAHRLGHSLSGDAVSRRVFKEDEPAFVYLITHAAYGAAKVGIAKASGDRLAQHRRTGWQILAIFQVTAKTAVAIEADILRWWRGELGLPSHLTHSQMPQGGWTETVAMSKVGLAATMTRICNLAAAAASPNA